MHATLACLLPPIGMKINPPAVILTWCLPRQQQQYVPFDSENSGAAYDAKGT
jgi:hypothetical protein